MSDIEANNRAKLSDIIATLLEIDPDEVTDDLSPQHVEHWDSLNHLNICTAVGQEFRVELTTDEMATIRNVGDLVRTLSKRGVHFE